MRLFISVFFIFSFLFVNSQQIEVEDRYDEFFGPKWAPHLAFRNVLLSKDYILGGEFGIMNPSRSLTFFGSFDLRPFRKKVLNYQGGNLFYQNAELRYFIGGGAEYLHQVSGKNYGGFVQVNGAYTWGEYGGSEVKPPQGFVIIPRLGIFWKLTRYLYLKGGYAYVDTTNDQVGKNRLYLSLSGIIVK